MKANSKGIIMDDNVNTVGKQREAFASARPSSSLSFSFGDFSKSVASLNADNHIDPNSSFFFKKPSAVTSEWMLEQCFQSEEISLNVLQIIQTNTSIDQNSELQASLYGEFAQHPVIGIEDERGQKKAMEQLTILVSRAHDIRKFVTRSGILDAARIHSSNDDVADKPKSLDETCYESASTTTETKGQETLHNLSPPVSVNKEESPSKIPTTVELKAPSALIPKANEPPSPIRSSASQAMVPARARESSSNMSIKGDAMAPKPVDTNPLQRSNSPSHDDKNAYPSQTDTVGVPVHFTKMLVSGRKLSKISENNSYHSSLPLLVSPQLLFLKNNWLKIALFMAIIAGASVGIALWASKDSLNSPSSFSTAAAPVAAGVQYNPSTLPSKVMDSQQASNPSLRTTSSPSSRPSSKSNQHLSSEPSTSHSIFLNNGRWVVTETEADVDIAVQNVGYAESDNKDWTAKKVETSMKVVIQKGSNNSPFQSLNGETFSFGLSISISSNALALVIGEPLTDLKGMIDVGSVHTYYRDVANIKFITQERFDGEESYGWFGSEVSMSLNGLFMVVSAPLTDGISNDNGSLSFYTRSSMYVGFTLKQKIVGTQNRERLGIEGIVIESTENTIFVRTIYYGSDWTNNKKIRSYTIECTCTNNDLECYNFEDYPLMKCRKEI